MAKKRVDVTISSNLYDRYKEDYNFSKILDEILTDFLIVEASTDSIDILEVDKVKLKTNNGKVYTLNGMAYRNFISFIMDISRR